MNRREFLNYSVWGLGVVIGGALFVPAATYFLSPAWREIAEDWILVGEVKKIPHGKPVQIDFLQRRKDGWMTVEEKRSAWVLTEDGKDFTVFNPQCTHLGCPYKWDAEREQFLCPCHAGVFAKNGDVLSGPPPRPLDRFPVKMDNGKLWIRPVSAENEEEKLT